MHFYKIKWYLMKLKRAIKYGILTFKGDPYAFEPDALIYTSTFLKEQEKLFKRLNRHGNSLSDAKRMRTIWQAIDLLLSDDYWDRDPEYRKVKKLNYEPFSDERDPKIDKMICRVFEREDRFQRETRQWIYKQLEKYSPGWWI